MPTKKITLAFLLMTVLEFTAFAQQYNPESDFEVNKLADGKSVEIKKYLGSKQTVSIPPMIQGLPVTSIGDYAFTDSNLISLTIPNSVTNIGIEAFMSCKGLTNITISKSVTRIGAGAFYGCKSLINITLSNSVTRIGENVFSSFNITIPDSVTSIEQGAFGSCESFTNVTIGNNVTSIGNFAFSRCTNLTSIFIPKSVKEIGERAFYGCYNLTNINIPDGVTSIGSYAFHGTALFNNQPDGVVYAGKVAYTYQGAMPNNTRIILLDGTKGIAGSAFRKNDLVSITIPNSVINIGEEAFYECFNLTSITIPDSVTSIGDMAFYNSNLTSITIGNSVKNIGSYVFQLCINLTSINVSTDNSEYTSVDGVLYNKNKTTLITYPAGKTNNSFTIPDSVTNIGERAFFRCTNLRSITIPDSVTSIGESAFVVCRNLTSVTFQGTITTGNFNDRGSFPGDLRNKFYATDKANGTPGIYKTTEPVNEKSVWTKQ